MNLASIATVLASFALGVLAWGSPAPGWVQGVSILMPVLWASASNRWIAGLVVMAYTTAASRGLIPGIAEFFDTNLAHGLALWLCAGLFTGLAGLLCWHRSAAVRVLLLPVLLLALIIPPAGLVGWAHPITAAGWLFPGAGWFGLAATVALAMLLAWQRPLLNAAAAVIPMLVVASLLAAPVERPSGWSGHNTNFHFGVGSSAERDPMKEIRRHWSMQSQVADGTGPVHVLPETVGGTWNDQASAEWERFLADQPGQTVLMGAYEPTSGQDYNNALVEVTAEGSRIIYRQRTPIPVGMWRPWSDASAVPQWLSQAGTVTVAGKQAAVLVCYEALLVWPVLHSIQQQPDLLLSVASTWWAPESIHRSQRNAMRAWSQLFNLPLVEAYNK